MVMYAYLLVLPFNSGFFRETLHILSFSASFLPHIIGLMMMLFLLIARKRTYKPSGLVIKLAFILVALNLSSLIMAIVQYQELGVLFGRNTITAVTPQIVYYFQILFVLIYNDYILTQIELKKVMRIVLVSFGLLFAIGYAQIISITTSLGVVNTMLEAINGLFFFDSVYVFDIHKINLMTMEASTAGAQISIFILPLLLALIRVQGINKAIGFGLIIALIPIILFNDSSSGLIGAAICLFAFLFLFPYISPLFVWNVRVYSILTVVLVVLIYSDNILQSDFYETMFVKIFTTDNLSTLHRTTSIYTNYQSFLDYPIFGVGNGIQGFYYLKYFPVWGFRSYESEAFYYGELGWPGSGAFLPTYLSAFGIVGLIILGYLVLILHRNIRSLKKTANHFMYEFLTVSFLSFLFQAYSTVDIIGNYYIIFILSLSAFHYHNQQETTPTKWPSYSLRRNYEQHPLYSALR
jgi:hypothetical protein